MNEQEEQQSLENLELVQRLSNRIASLEIKVAELAAGQKNQFNMIKQMSESLETITSILEGGVK
jgi:C4-dicarboxylate-specific signal transduction histidine kinase